MRASRLIARTWFVVAVGAVWPALGGVNAARVSALPQPLPSREGGVWWPMTDTASAPGPRSPLLTVRASGPSELHIAVDLTGVELARHDTRAGAYLTAGWPDAALAGRVGEPAVPVVRRLFLAPPGAAVDVSVATGSDLVIDLAAAGFEEPLLPMQAPIPMTVGDPKTAPWACAAVAYATDGAQPATRATVHELGLVRGHALWLLEVRPLAYNPARHVVTAWPHIEVQLTFRGGRAAGLTLGPLASLREILLNPPAPPPAGDRAGNNFLIIVADDFASTISAFAAAKTGQGFAVMTHTVSAGTSASQIKDYIASLWGTPGAPDYILLVGDTNTIPCWTGGGASYADTDLPYACMDEGDDWLPEIAIGRFSVQTTDQLQAVIDKTLCLEEGTYAEAAYTLRASFVAGNDSGSGDHDAHNQVIETYLEPSGYECERLFYRESGADTPEVTAAVNDGRIFCVYFGHSSSSGWFLPSYGAGEVYALTNEDLYGVLVSFSCNTARFTVGECFGEAWQRAANKGAAVFLGTSTYIYWTSPPWVETADLYDYIFRVIYVHDEDRLGPALYSACYRLLGQYGEDDPVCRDYFEMFILLGDPSLQVPRTPAFSLSATPDAQDVCAPDDAAYTIDVGQVFGFTDTVALVAEGVPPGATVDFSINHAPPPFTTVMTISNTGAAPAGDYTIEILGSGAGIGRSTQVELTLSQDVPGQVTLSSPPDDAVAVSRHPTLTWQPMPQAWEYAVQLATDEFFTSVLYSAVTAEISHAVGLFLEPETDYYWRVRAVNACGPGAFSAPFSFTTNSQANYFTQQFPESGGEFDLDYRMITFVPDGSGDYYASCANEIAELPTDPSGGTELSLSDDGYQAVSTSRAVWLYAELYQSFYVNSNGNITFGDGDGDYTESLEDHFNVPRISALFDDLNPSTGGLVSWQELADRVAVTWEDVPQYGSSDSNTFQVELFFNGDVRLSWAGVDSADNIVGLSAGIGMPADYLASDQSAAGLCNLPGDLNCSGLVDFFDIDAFVLALTSPSAYVLAYPGCDIGRADVNFDGAVNFFDIDEFVFLLTSPPSGPTYGYWRFEESGSTVIDASHQGLGGSAFGNPSYSTDVAMDHVPRTGAANTQSIELNGTSQYIVIPGGPRVSYGDANFTIEAWVQLAPSGGPYLNRWVALQKEIGYGDRDLDYAFLVNAGTYGASGYELALVIGNGSLAWTLLSGFEVTDTDWHYVSVAFDADNDDVRFVLDDEVETFGFTDQGHQQNTGLLIFGAHHNSSGVFDQYFSGKLDEVRISPYVVPLDELLSAE